MSCVSDNEEATPSVPGSIDDEIEAFITRPAPTGIDWRIWQAIRATSRSSALAYLLGALNDEINAKTITAETVASVIRSAMAYATNIETASAADFTDQAAEK